MENRPSHTFPQKESLEEHERRSQSGESGNARPCPSDSQPAPANNSHQPAQSVVVTITDPRGLHLRSGRDVVRTASQFQARITAANLSRNSSAVDLKSILQLIQLQARQGHELQLAASGPDAEAAIEALRSLF